MVVDPGLNWRKPRSPLEELVGDRMTLNQLTLPGRGRGAVEERASNQSRLVNASIHGFAAPFLLFGLSGVDRTTSRRGTSDTVSCLVRARDGKGTRCRRHLLLRAHRPGMGT